MDATDCPERVEGTLDGARAPRTEARWFCSHEQTRGASREYPEGAGTHRCVFTLCALDDRPKFAKEPTREEFETAVRGHVPAAAG